MIRIAITEDNRFLADSLSKKLALDNEFQLKFIASNGSELLAEEKLLTYVDVVLMDLQMPVMDGIEATSALKKKFPNIKVLVLTVDDQEATILKAIQSGANGYLLKDQPPERLHQAIKSVFHGEGDFSPQVSMKLIQFVKRGETNQQETKKDYSLTTREREILKHLAVGQSHSRIAETLHISPNTVRRHMENIYSKLEVNNKVQAVNVALKHNLIEP